MTPSKLFLQLSLTLLVIFPLRVVYAQTESNIADINELKSQEAKDSALIITAELAHTIEDTEVLSHTTQVKSHTTQVNDIQPQMAISEQSFSCIRDMTPVRHFYVDNLLGNVDETLAVANNPKGNKYPVGSVVQLVPTEVMVKREVGTSPVTGDWEFFELTVDENGTDIAKRGFVDVNNRFGGNCFACHLPARDDWDFICESDHGCEPIPIDHSITGALQRSDPRCGEPALESGDTMALFKLKTMMMLGGIKQWFASF